MRMDQVEMADKILDLENPVDERPAHVVDIVHKVVMRRIRASMIVNALYLIVTSLARHPSSEDVNLVAFSCKGSCQFTDMDGYPSNSD